MATGRRKTTEVSNSVIEDIQRRNYERGEHRKVIAKRKNWAKEGAIVLVFCIPISIFFAIILMVAITLLLG